jgi:hypothetical protein
MLDLSTYPHGAPGFIADHPAPVDWQRKVQAIDPDLVVAWNPHHRHGPWWAIMRYHGRVTRGVPILSRGGSGTWSSIFKAMAAGWSFIKPLFDPDGQPVPLDSSYGDVLLAELRQSDMRQKFGRDPDEALQKIAREETKGKLQRDDAHDTLIHEAFDEAIKEEQGGSPLLILPKPPLKTRSA